MNSIDGGGGYYPELSKRDRLVALLRYKICVKLQVTLRLRQLGDDVRLTLAVHGQSYTIHSFSPETVPPAGIFDEPMFFIGKTREELSIVVPSHLTLDSLEAEPNWHCIEVLGPLGFSMTGILARLSTVLSDAKISIFAISTFDTDYVLVKKDKLPLAVSALKKNGYHVIEYPCEE